MTEKQSDNKINSPTSKLMRQVFPIIFTLFLGCILSLLLFILVYNWEQNRQRIEFESRSKSYANAVQTRLNSYVETLHSLGDFFNSSEQVTRQMFSSFTKGALARHTGIQALGWDPLVLNNERAGFESLAREEGFENFVFTELTEEKKLIRAAQRPEYVVVYYIEPQVTNKPALGFDIASNPKRLGAITKGFDTGELTATGKITLVQETGQQFGILILLPIYQRGVLLKSADERRKYRRGFVVEVLRIGDVVEGAMKNFSDEGINIYLYDLEGPTEDDRFLYFKPSGLGGMTEQPLKEKAVQQEFFWSDTFDFVGHKWKILFRPSSSYIQTHYLWHAWVVLFASLLLTFMATYYLWRKLKYTEDIEQRVIEQAQTNHELESEVSVRKRAEEEREKLIIELQNALNEVKTLHGIIPICSHCKEIRDDKGLWKKLEAYIHEHSEAKFSHSICPKCANQFYPDMDLYPKENGS